MRNQAFHSDDLDDGPDEMMDDGVRRARWWSTTGAFIVRRPKDAVALLVVSAGALCIMTNALFMQSGPHPAPIFANFTPPVAVKEIAVRAEAAPIAETSDLTAAAFAPPDTTRLSTGSTAAAARQKKVDPIGDLVARTNRLVAVQETLAAFGYGQIAATGTYDAKTKAAIERFQRERHMPVTGQISDALYAAVNQMAGNTLD